jgi:hypothetical protein
VASDEPYLHLGNVAERVQTRPYAGGHVAVFSESAELVADPRTVIVSGVRSTEQEAREEGEAFLRTALAEAGPGEVYEWRKDGRAADLHRIWRTDLRIPKPVV